MLKGDTRPWRDVGHAKWRDSLAALEYPYSREFKEAVKSEDDYFSAAVRKVRPSKWITAFEHFYKTAIPTKSEFSEETIHWPHALVKFQYRPGHRLNVWLSTTLAFEGLTDFGCDPESGLFYTICDIGEGAQINELAMYEMQTNDKFRRLWKHSPVGPNAAFGGDSIYFCSIENALRSSGVQRVGKSTGRDIQTVYHNDDGRFQVELHNPPRQSDIFVRICNALTMRIGILSSRGVAWLSDVPPTDANGAGETLLPLTRDVYATNDSIRVNGKKHKFPTGFLESAVPAFDKNSILLTTVLHGCPTLQLFDIPSGQFIQLLEIKEPAEIVLHSHATSPTISVQRTWSPKELYELVSPSTLVKICTFPCPLALPFHAHGMAKTANADIPYTIVAATKNPRKLLVEAYGSYGISASRGYPVHWLPWLSKGYALVIAMPRGGRENGDAWYNAARTALRKKTTFDDVAAVIKTVQTRYRFRAENTVFYGRSAGGWLAAYLGLAYPKLLAAVYAEVPYLDVLRTTTNPDLPLTALEYDEFGNPRVRPKEFTALQTISPVDLAASLSSSTPFFLVRTALHDAQVLPYEAVKFSTHLRRNGSNIIVGIDHNGGHFSAEKTLAVQLGIDAALLDAQIAPTHPLSSHHTRRKLRSHTLIGIRSRRTNSRKHRVRHSTSPDAV